MDHLRVVVGAYHVQDGVGLPDVGEELVPEALALVRAAHQSGDVVKLDRLVDHRLRAHGRGDPVEALVGHADNGDVRLDRRERVVGGRCAGTRERVEQRGLTRVRHANDAYLHTPGRMFAPAKLEDGRTVRIGPQQVRYVRRGAPGAAPGDLPIVVLHGWGAHIEAVGPILAALEGAAEVIALDLPGFGESAPPPEAWDVDSYARFMGQFLDELAVKRAHVVGHSHGGRVAIALAADQPERVGRLLLVDSAGIRPRRGWRYRRRVAVAKVGRVIGKLRSPGRRIQDRMRARVASRDYLEASEAMRGTFRAVIAADLRERMPRIAAPTLLVWGDRDYDTPLWMGQEMERLIPDAGLVVLEGAGHYSYADSPGQFGAVARRFLVDQPRAVAAGGEDARAGGG